MYNYQKGRDPGGQKPATVKMCALVSSMLVWFPLGVKLVKRLMVNIYRLFTEIFKVLKKLTTNLDKLLQSFSNKEKSLFIVI